MALRTRLGEILRPLNAEYGKVVQVGVQLQLWVLQWDCF